MPTDVLLDNVNELDFGEWLLECQLLSFKLTPEALHWTVVAWGPRTRHACAQCLLQPVTCCMHLMCKPIPGQSVESQV